MTLLPSEDEFSLNYQAACIGELVKECHGRSKNAGWYQNPKTGEPLARNVGEMLCLIHSEVSEALEGHRKNLDDDHLPGRKKKFGDVTYAVVKHCPFCGAQIET